MVELFYLFLLIMLGCIGIIIAKHNINVIEHKNRQYLKAINSVKPKIKKWLKKITY